MTISTCSFHSQGKRSALLALFGSLCLVFAAHAGEFDGHYKLRFTNAGWDNSAFHHAAFRSNPSKFFWDDRLAPHEGVKYYVGPGLTMNSPETNVSEAITYAFKGDELVFDQATFRHNMVDEYAVIRMPKARFLGGSVIAYPGTRTCEVSGWLSIESTESSPVKLDQNAYEFRYARMISARLTGEASAYLMLTNSYKGWHPENNSIMDLALTGDCSGYLGTLRVCNWGRVHTKGVFGGTVELDSGAVYRSYYCLYRTGTGTEYGASDAQSVNRLVIHAGGEVQLEAATPFTVNDLEFEDGASIAFDASGTSVATVNVTGTITANGKLTLVFDGTPVIGENPPRFALIRYTGSGAIDPGDFTLAPTRAAVSYSPNGALLPIPHYSLVVEDGVLYAQQKEIVKCINGSKESPASGYSPFNAAQDADGNYYWSNHRAPEPGKDYYNDGTYRLSPNGDGNPWCEFLGDSLTLVPTIAGGASLPGNGQTLGIFIREFNVSCLAKMEIWGGSYMSEAERNEFPDLHQQYRFTITGDVFRTYLTTQGGVPFLPFSNRTVLLASELTGDGNVVCMSSVSQQSTGAYRPNGIYEFSRANTNFTGKITVTMPDASDAVRTIPNETNFIAFILRDARSIGGARDTFRYDAFQVEQMSMLRVADDVTVDQTNLGIFFNGRARVNVETDRTFAVNNPITYGGIVRKEGAGTFAIGATPRFTDGGEATAPTAEKNVLRIAKGFVKPTVGTALDGVEVRFADGGSGLAFDMKPKDATLAKYGVVCTKWSTPFVFESGVASVSVRLDATGSGTAEATGDVAIATFATEAAARAFMGRIAFSRPCRGVRVAADVVQNDIGTYTLRATVSETGLAVLFR